METRETTKVPTAVEAGTGDPSAVISVLNDYRPPQEILNGLISLMEAQAPDLIGSILYVDKTGRKLRHGAAPSLPLSYISSIDGVEIGDNVGSCGTAAWLGEPVYADDIASDRRWEGFSELALCHGLVSCWSNPLINSRGQLLGTLAVYRRETGPANEQHLRVMEIATDLAIAVISRHRSAAELSLRDHAFASSSNGIVIVDALQPDAPVVYCNPAFEKLTGYDQSEVLGRNCRFLQNEDRDQPGIAVVRQAVKEGHEVTTRLRNYRKNGEMFWSELRISPVRNEHGEITHFLGFQNDVTTQQLSRLALEESEGRFRRMSSQAPIGIFMTAPNGDCEYINEALSQIMSVSLADVRGDRWTRYLHSHDRDRVEREWAATLKDGTPFQSEFRFLREDGVTVWVHGQAVRKVDTDQRHLGYIGTIRDITERRQIEDQLRFTQFSVDSCSTAIFWIEPDGRFIYVNEAVVEKFGFSREEMLTMSVSDIDPAFPPDVFQTFWTRIEERKSLTFESQIVRKDGKPVPVTITTNFMECQGQQFVFAFVTDITERRIAEEQLKTLNASLEARVDDRTIELKRANDDLDAYAQSVAHDLRAPLRAIRGFGIALVEDYQDRLDDEALGYLNYIVSAGHEMDELIRDLLEYSQVGSSEMSLDPHDLDDVVSMAVRQLHTQINSSQASISVASPLGIVVGRRSSLLQLLLNLLSNGIKFVGKDVQPHIFIRTETQSDRLRLWVEDNGIGIPAADQERIFRVFERLHGVETFPGTGVGLAIVRRTAESMGGDFGVESEPGRGSGFWVDFRTR